ncbi:MAG: hypothetical protein R6V15_06180 [Desulfotignum sp.]
MRFAYSGDAVSDRRTSAGFGMISGGFVPLPLHHVTEYSPSLHELAVSALFSYGVAF